MKPSFLQRLKSAARAFSSVSLQPWADFWYEAPGVATWAGEPVTATTAMRVTAVYACVRVRSETIASVPWHLFQRRQAGSRQKTIANENRLYPIVHDAPNPEQSGFEWREMMVGHLTLRGNAYSLIDYDGSGFITALWPIHPDSIRAKRDPETQQIFYEVFMQGGRRERYPAYRILHLRGLSDDGLHGLGPLQLAFQQIAASAAADEYSARFWKNDGTPPGLLTTPNPMGKNAEESQEIKDAARQRWRESMTGSNRHMIPVLDNDLKWQSVGLDPEASQALETRNFMVSDIARAFRTPPSKIGHHVGSDLKGKYEEEALSFVTDTIRPEVVRIEQAMNRRLLLPDERRDFFIEANLEGLLRGDIKSRYEAFKVAWSNGWMNADEIRDIESMNPQPDGQGSVYWAPVNMAPIGMILNGEIRPGQTGGDANPKTPPTTNQSARAFAAMLVDRGVTNNGSNGHGEA